MGTLFTEFGFTRAEDGSLLEFLCPDVYTMARYSYDRRAMNLPFNHLDRFPSGKWGFVGRVDGRLMYENKHGGTLTPEEAREISQSSNPAMVQKIHGIRTRVWDDPMQACLAAKKFGQGVTVAQWMIDKNPEIGEALEKSGVKHKIQ